jgi:hypothetical protein
MVMIPVLIALAVSPAFAQTSASYRLTEHAFNAGGHPAAGETPASASYRMSLHAIGDNALGEPLASASFHADGGFVVAYPPPGEVTELRFTDKQTMLWNPERSVGVYNLYRDLMSNLSSLGYGTCRLQDLAGETAFDTDEPNAGDGYFYLVTAENRLYEEGSKGFDSDGTVRANDAPCP